MKTKLFAIMLAGASVIFSSCNDDDDNISVDSSIENTFNSQYPEAQRVSWERKSNYYVADFILKGLECEAWYDNQGIWYMTETDIHYNALPEEVKNGFLNSEFKDWRIEDIDLLERKDMEKVYILEVESGKQEYDLYFSNDGTLIKAVPDSDYTSEGHLPNTLPDAVKNYIKENYPQAKIVETDIEKSKIEVDILDNGTPLELNFSLQGEWIYTKKELRAINEVPATVKEALEASEYSSWRVDDIDFYQTPDGDYYKFELESGEREIEIKITNDGKIDLYKRN